MKKKIIYFLFMLSIILSSCNCDFFGAHDLGNNLTLLEGDKMEDRIIVYCTAKSGGCCKGGMYIIPSVGNQYHMYVETAKSNEKWVIAKSIQIKDKQQKYWIISKNFSIASLDCDKVKCDSIIKSYVQGPFDIKDFNETILEQKIDLSF